MCLCEYLASVRNSLWLEWLDHCSYRSYSYLSSHDLIFSSFSLSVSLQWLLFFIKISVPALPKRHALLSPQISFFTAGVVRHIQSTEWEAQLGLTLKICVCVWGEWVSQKVIKVEKMCKVHLWRVTFWLSFCFLTFPGELLYIFIWEEDTCSGMRRRKGGSINGHWQAGTFQHCMQ